MLKRKNSSQHLSYSEQGHGPVIVLLNGLSRTSKHWLGFETMLANRFRVLTIDLPGAGQSQRACPWSLTVEDMAEEVIEVLDSLKVEQAHIMGVSLGGMVAMACGITYPHRCASLTVINSSIGQTRQKVPRISSKAISLVFKAMIIRPQAHILERAITDLVVGIDCLPDQRQNIANKLTELTRKQAPNPLNILKQLLAAYRFHPEENLSKLKVPTLVVQGSHDFFVPPINSKRIAESIPDAKLLTIVNGGHELMFDKADELLAAQIDWMDQLDSYKNNVKYQDCFVKSGEM